MDAVGRMVDAYGLPDPAAGNGPGVFEDERIQALYDGLVSNGSVSGIAALEAGHLVEETDFVDLDRAIAVSRHDDITAVYRNLRQGSLNHLAAFNNCLATRDTEASRGYRQGRAVGAMSCRGAPAELSGLKSPHLLPVLNEECAVAVCHGRAVSRTAGAPARVMAVREKRGSVRLRSCGRCPP